MSNPLIHSPSDIARWLLIATGYGTDPALGQAWPIYVSSEPALPDNVVTLTDTQGMDDGRDMITGSAWLHYGLQFRIRSSDEPTGYTKANALRDGLATSIYQRSITIDGTHYTVHCFSRFGNVLTLGKETPTSKRSLFTLNCLVSLKRA